MRQTKQLSEASIKIALSQGYITSSEARQMLRVYLHKSHFSPSPKKHYKSHITA